MKMGFIEKIAEAMRPTAKEPQSTANTSSEADQAATEATGTNDAVTPKTQNENVDGADEGGSTSPEGEKSYSQDELDSILEERKKEWEKERLSSLSKDSQIEELKKELLKRDLKEKVFARLEEAKLPTGVAEFVQYTDEAGTMESLEKVITTVGQLVQEGVMLRLRGKTPEGLGNAANVEDPFAKAFVDSMKK